MSGPSRILIVSPGVPHPNRGASTVLFYHYIDAIRSAGHTILHIVLLDPTNSDEESFERYRSSMMGPCVDVLPCRADRFTTQGRWRIDLDTDAIDALRTAVAGFEPRVGLAFDIVSAWASLRFAVPRRMSWLGDLMFQAQWYNALYDMREGTGRRRRLLTAFLISRAWRRTYRRVLGSFDTIIVSSHSSESQLSRLGLDSRYLPYPWPDSVHPEHHAEASPPERPTFLFFGSLVGLGSRSGLRNLVHRVYPELVRIWGPHGFRIRVCGRNAPSAWIEQVLNGRPELEYLGFVENLDLLMASCHAVLVPIDVPVGNRSRILTAMAKGAPIIAHRNAALGNPDLIDGQSCWLAKTPKEFAEAMRRAIEEPDTRDRIAKGGRLVYERRFQPATACPDFLAEIEVLSRTDALPTP